VAVLSVASDDLDTFDPDSEGAVRAMLAGWLYTWFAAAERQAMRTLHPQHRSDYQVEGYLFILAVRQVLRAVEAARSHADQHRDGKRSAKLTKALATFDTTVDAARMVRDVLTHFDKYQRGKGDLQLTDKRAGRDPRRLNVYYENTGSTIRLHLMPNVVMDVGTTLDAAGELVEEVSSALADDDA
jgi:hypothetical protein